jgi:hypothetical protein
VAASQPLDVTIKTVSVWDSKVNSSFSASGPAVDAGIICPSGYTISVTPSVHSDKSKTVSKMFVRVYELFTCDDGSGTFTLRYRMPKDFDSDSARGKWKIIKGTGNYYKLRGNGNLVGIPSGIGLFVDFTGRIHIH